LTYTGLTVTECCRSSDKPWMDSSPLWEIQVCTFL